MELKEVIEKRYSCRNYLPFSITDNQIKLIVESARLAPSSKNAQQWKFVCIKAEKECHDIANMLEEYYIKNKDNPQKIAGAGSTFATGKILEQCPAIILVFEDSKYISRDKVEDISGLLSIGAAVEHMALTATDMGLGSLWIADTFYIHEQVADYILNKLKGSAHENFIDKNNRLICAMAIGEPAESGHSKNRKSLDDILCIINI